MARVFQRGERVSKYVAQVNTLSFHFQSGGKLQACQVLSQLGPNWVTCTALHCTASSVHCINLHWKQEHKVSYRCSLPSPLQKRSKDYKGLHRIHVVLVPSDSVPPLLHFFFKLNPLIFSAASFLCFHCNAWKLSCHSQKT